MGMALPRGEKEVIDRMAIKEKKDKMGIEEVKRKHGKMECAR